MERKIGIEEMIDRAARHYRAARPNEKDRHKLNKYIREYLRKSGVEREGKSYRIPTYYADQLITYDLRPYLAKLFAHNKFDPAIEDAKQSVADAKDSLKKQREYLESYDPQTEWTSERISGRYEGVYEVPEPMFNSMLLKALMRKVYPEFNEAAFRDDFAKRESLQPELQHPQEGAADDPEMVRAAMAHDDLSHKLDPAILFGELDAYLTLKPEGRNNGSA